MNITGTEQLDLVNWNYCVTFNAYTDIELQSRKHISKAPQLVTSTETENTPFIDR